MFDRLFEQILNESHLDEVWIEPNGVVTPVKGESHDDEAFSYFKDDKDVVDLNIDQVLLMYGKSTGNIRAGSYSSGDISSFPQPPVVYVSIISRTVTSSQWRAICKLEKEGISFSWDFQDIRGPSGKDLRSLRAELVKQGMMGNV